ncbi:MAG: acetylglutamate kinase, partial [Spirochaetes bacterium]
ASHIAVAVNADKYITLTNVPGILKNPDDPKTKISYISKEEIKRFIEEGIIKGGMIPKINECIYALEHGVSRVHILNGFEKNSILREVFTNIGTGTMILREEDIKDYKETGF